MKVLFFLALAGLMYGEEPWGKDADLTHRKVVSCEERASPTPLSVAAEKMIRFHQEVISPADGPRSHFIPSSSQYMLDAIHKYGFFKGFPMGCDRLLRENNDPWVYRKTLNGAGVQMKYDPVK
jgi:putative component of membrane protein insertase Oxa1/YidC/SpoIIIJ protein YidD